MVSVKVEVRNSEFVQKEFCFDLQDGATIVDVLKKVSTLADKDVFRMVFHPKERRFYNQVAILGFTKEAPFVDVRQVDKPLPDGIKIVLVPQGTCTTEWEDPL